MLAMLAPKQVQCNCGHSFETTKKKSWCQKCCRPVFYYEKDKRKYQINHYYMITVMVMVMMFIGFIFIEMIAKPLLSL